MLRRHKVPDTGKWSIQPAQPPDKELASDGRFISCLHLHAGGHVCQGLDWYASRRTSPLEEQGSSDKIPAGSPYPVKHLAGTYLASALHWRPGTQ